MPGEDALLYAKILVMLNILLGRNLITKTEYEVIKEAAKEKYHIISEFTA